MYGSVRENRAHVLRLRQNVFALARHLQLSPSQLKEIAQRVDEVPSTESGVDAGQARSQRRRSLNDILLGPTGSVALSDRSDTTTSPVSPSSTSFSFENEQAGNASQPTSKTNPDDGHRPNRPIGLSARPRSVEAAIAGESTSAGLSPSLCRSGGTEPLRLLDGRPHVLRRAWPIGALTQSDAREQARRISPHPDERVHSRPSPAIPADRFHAFRLPAPRPTQSDYVGVGPRLDAYVTGGGRRREAE